MDGPHEDQYAEDQRACEKETCRPASGRQPVSGGGSEHSHDGCKVRDTATHFHITEHHAHNDAS